MRRLFLFLIILIIFLATKREASAGRYGLLLFGTPHQQVDLSYQFNGEQQVLSSTRHEMVEDYTFRIKYAVGRPSLLKGSFATTLSLGQQILSTSVSSNGDQKYSHIGFLYDINGILFSESHAPAAFSAKSSITQISNPFSRSYQLTDSTYDLRWMLRNNFLPVTVEYLTGTSETNGQQIDYTRSRNEVDISAKNVYSISTTSLDLSTMRNTYTPVVGESTFDNRYEARLQNQLAWENGGKTRSIGSGLRYAETGGINQSKSFAADETMTWQLGKALRSGGEYSYSSITGSSADQTNQNASLWLQHQLFRSVSTWFGARGRQSNYANGNDREISGGASVTYTKSLPRESNLNVTLRKDYGIDERNLGTGQLHVFEERHAITAPVLPFDLVQPNVIVSSITVRNENPIRPTPVYTIQPDPGNPLFTQIVPGANVDPGDILLVTYDYKVDPKLTTVNDSYNIDGSVQIFGGLYRIYGSYYDSKQERTSGQATLAGLAVQQSGRFGVERKGEKLTLTGEYATVTSEADAHQSIMAQAVYSNPTPDGTLTVQMRDQYQWYDSATSGGISIQRKPENYFTAAAVFSRWLRSTLYMTLTGNYVNVMGTNSGDSLSIGSALRWALGKISVNFDSSFGLRREASATALQEMVRIRVIRYF